jgi:hypothetical protein
MAFFLTAWGLTSPDLAERIPNHKVRILSCPKAEIFEVPRVNFEL